MIRILHTADWHADSDREKQMKFDHAMEKIGEYLQSNTVDAIVHAGDIWERKQSYTVNSGVPDVMHWLRLFSKYVPHIFIVKGNNSHDEPGSVALLNNLEPNIHAVEEPVMFFVNGPSVNRFSLNDYETCPFDSAGTPQYIVTLIPYPTKSFFIGTDSIDNSNAALSEKIDDYFREIGDIASDFKCPKVLAFHGNVSGSRLSSGQSLISQDIMIAPSSLKNACHDYYALGHIHFAQEVAENMYYSGSVYNKNWGETEQKGFRVVEFNNDDFLPRIFQNSFVPIQGARPMWTVDATFSAEEGFVDSSEAGSHGEVRYRVTVKESDRALLTREKLLEQEGRFVKNGNRVKVEVTVIPNERESRNEAIMRSRTLLDEVCEYAGTAKQEIDEVTIAEKVRLIETGGVL